MEKVNFNLIKSLFLNNNQISDISVLEKVNFKNLEELDLSNNNIDIDKYSSIIDKLLLMKSFKI